jgi:hypothetical protein
MRRRRLWKVLLGIVATGLISVVCAAWPGRSSFTVGVETTYVTGPLDKHGDIDYVAALNERLREGITPENNANVLIWQVFGPRPEGRPMHAEYFEWLQIEPPPEKGDYWVSWLKYLREQVKPGSGVPLSDIGPVTLDVPTRPWTAKENPQLAGWLKRNEKPLAVAVQATRRPEYFNPLVPKRDEEWSPGLLAALLPTVQKCRELATALVSRAMLRVAEGKEEGAWQDLLACRRLGRLVARGGSLIELLVGLAIERIAKGGDVGFLDQAMLTSKQVLACWEELQRLPPMPPFADKIDYCERLFTLETILLSARQGTLFLDSLSGSGSKPSKSERFRSRLFTKSINWDPAFRSANRWYDRAAAILRITDRKERTSDLEEFLQELRNLKQEVTAMGVMERMFMDEDDRGELIGKILIGLMLPAFNKVQDAVDRGEQDQRNLNVAFALAAYQRDKGRYPAKLDELVPAYLKKIPDDLFSDKPPIYRQQGTGYLLYSVGLNGIDEDGRSYGDEPAGDDLNVRIPVPAPRGKK